MNEDLKKIEAVLFLSPFPLLKKEIAFAAGVDEDKVLEYIEKLNEIYERCNLNLKIYKINNKFYMYMDKNILSLINYPFFNENERKFISILYSKGSISFSKAKLLVSETTINKLKARNIIEEYKIKNKKYLKITDYFKKNFFIK